MSGAHARRAPHFGSTPPLEAPMPFAFCSSSPTMGMFPITSGFSSYESATVHYRTLLRDAEHRRVAAPWDLSFNRY